VFLDDEMSDSTLPLLLEDESVVYKKFKIKTNTAGLWELYSNTGILYSFKLKASAVLAAEYYDMFLFNKIKELQILDKEYYYAITNLIFLYSQLPSIKDQQKRDILQSRIDFARTRSSQLRRELKSRFSSKFG
jgi:hypothetical protein